VTRVKISYCVKCDVAEWDDAQELPKRCFPMTRDRVVELATVSVQQREVKKLYRAVKTNKPTTTTLCFAMDYYEPCIPAETLPIDKLEYCEGTEVVGYKNCEVATIDSVKILHCSITILTQKKKIPYEEVYIRPLVRLYPKEYTNTIERRQRAKTEKPVIQPEAPTQIKCQNSRFQNTDRSVSKYHYSSSSDKPTYPRTSHYRTAYLASSSRARSEFRERRSYFSLYQ